MDALDHIISYVIEDRIDRNKTIVFSYGPLPSFCMEISWIDRKNFKTYNSMVISLSSVQELIKTLQEIEIKMQDPIAECKRL